VTSRVTSRVNDESGIVASPTVPKRDNSREGRRTSSAARGRRASRARAIHARARRRLKFVRVDRTRRGMATSASRAYACRRGALAGRTLETRARRSVANVATRRGRASRPIVRADSESMAGISTQPTDEDVKTFNRLMQASSWEEMVENIKASANAGELSTGVLGAGYLVFSESKKRGENAQTLNVLQNIIQVMTQAVMTMTASPAQRAMDELMEIPVEEERKLVDRIEQAYNDGVDSYGIAECLKEFIQNLQVQEMSFELETARARDAKWDDKLAQLETLEKERVEAQKRAMNILKLIGVDVPTPDTTAQASAGPAPESAAPSPFQDQTD